MPRLLVMTERTVTEVERAAYLQTLAVRRERAGAVSANFWVFECLNQRGRFLEFVEAGSAESLEEAVTAVVEDRASALQMSVVWREVKGLN